MAAFASFASSLGPVAIDGHGDSIPFKTELCEGHLCFAHRPQEGDGWKPPRFIPELLKLSGPPDAVWELQVQMRFRVQPKGQIFVGFECREGPLQLGPVSRAFARGALGFGQSLASSRGVDIRITFGDERRGINPHIAIPVSAFLRMFRSSEPVPLPIMHAPVGTWHSSKGTTWEAIERPTVLDTEHYWTFAFNAINIDWHMWSLVGIPLIDSIRLSRLMGPQGLFASLYDDGREDREGSAEDPAARARHFVEVEFFPPECRHQLKRAHLAPSEASTAEDDQGDPAGSSAATSRAASPGA